MLGKTRDKDSEDRIGNEIFSLFKQKVGETGRFFKYKGTRVIEVNDERALKSEYEPMKCVCVFLLCSSILMSSFIFIQSKCAEIIDDIYRRNKNDVNWSSSPGKEQNECETSTPSRVFLSLRNNYYKDTMWRYFRMLGTTRDKDSEARIGNEIFSLFKQKVGESGRFFKYKGIRVIEVNDERALKSEYEPMKCVCVC